VFRFEKGNTQSQTNEKTMELMLTEHAKKLIDEFGFIPLGGLIFPDGRKSWEIDYGSKSKISKAFDKSASGSKYGIEMRTVEQQEELDMSLVNLHPNRENMGTLMHRTKSEYLNKLNSDPIVQDKLEKHPHFQNNEKNLKALYYLFDDLTLKESFRIVGKEQLKTLMKKLEGTNKFIVYRFINKKTGLERHGETTRELLERITEYHRGAEDLSRSPKGAFFEQMNLNLEMDKHSFTTSEDRFESFFGNYEVEIWICNSEMEMHALEILNILYYNRKSGTDILCDLGINNYYNEIIGNLNRPKGQEAIVGTAMDMLSLFDQALLPHEFDRGYSRMNYYCLVYLEGRTLTTKQGVNVHFSRNDFPSSYDIKAPETKAELYDKFLKYYVIETCKRDATFKLKPEFQELDDLIWVAKDKEGNELALSYGYRIDEYEGEGFIHSFINSRDHFNYWISETIKPVQKLSIYKISKILYEIIVEGNLLSDRNNIRKYQHRTLDLTIKITFLDNGVIKKVELIQS
jgi:hypothetical protein